MRTPRIPNFIKRTLFILFLIGIAYVVGNDTFNLLNSTEYNGLMGEILGGIATTFVLILLGAIFRPIIEISPKISMDTDLNCEDVFILKMYNSGFMRIYDVRASLTKVTYTKTHDGKVNASLQGIPITFPYIEVVPPWTSFKARKQGNEFAIQYKVKPHEVGDNIGKCEDVNSILSNKEDYTHYRLTISCTSGLTGLKHLKSENYTYKSSIVKGEFKSGATFIIK
jgi:hypothetical protein